MDKFIKKLLYLTIYSLIFIIPLSFFLPCHESFEMPKSTNFYIFIYVSIFLFIITLLNKKNFYLTPFSFALILLAFIFFLSFLKSLLINKYALPLHWQYLKLVFLNVILYFIIINSFYRKDVIKLLFFLILSHFLVTLYGVLQYFGIDFINWISFGEGRVYSTMGNPDYMAAQFSILFPIVIMLTLSEIKNQYKIFLLIFLIFMFFLIIVSHGRGAWLGFFGALFYIFLMIGIFYGKQFFIKYKFYFAFLIIFLIFLILLFTIPNPINKNPITNRIKQGLSLESDSVVMRLFYWKSAILMAIKNPFLGVGIGGFSLYTSYYQKMVYDFWLIKFPNLAKKVEPHVELYVHNDYLQTLAETGFLGFGVYILVFFAILFFSIKKAIKEENIFYKNLLLGLTGGVISFLINSIFNFPWKVTPTLILLFLFFSIFSIFENKKTFNIDIPFKKTIFVLSFIFLIYLSVLQFKSFLANICIKTGQTFFNQNQFEKARDIFELALSSNPRGTDKIELVLYTGNAYNSLKQIDKAIYYYNEGLKMFPNFIEARYNVANVYMNNNLTEKAIEEYQKVLALNPKFINAINNLANIYFAKGEYEKAKNMYEEVLKIKPEQPDARFNLAASYYRLKKYDLAYQELKKILEYAPDYELAKEWIRIIENLGLLKNKK